jgi:hypothetical protein
LFSGSNWSIPLSLTYLIRTCINSPVLAGETQPSYDRHPQKDAEKLQLATILAWFLFNIFFPGECYNL